MQFCTLFGFICGGAVLQWFGPEGKTLGFAGLFVFAGCSRLLSAHLLSKQSEPIPLPPGQKHVGPVELLLRLRKGPDGRLILYMFCVTFAAQVAAPFFTPFMVSQLKLSWMDYTWLIAVSFAARVVSLPFLGAFAKRKGAGSLLLAAGILIAPISAAWIFAWQSFVALFVIQILAGIVWGAYELATTLLIFERIAPEERTSILTTHNFINAVTMVTGSLLGATVLGTFQESFTGYLVIFGLSGALRAATVLLLLRTWRIPTSGAMIPMRTMAIRPYGNTVTQPILDHDHRK
jgi:MFS family permease